MSIKNKIDHFFRPFFYLFNIKGNRISIFQLSQAFRVQHQTHRRGMAHLRQHQRGRPAHGDALPRLRDGPCWAVVAGTNEAHSVNLTQNGSFREQFFESGDGVEWVARETKLRSKQSSGCETEHESRLKSKPTDVGLELRQEIFHSWVFDEENVLHDEGGTLACGEGFGDLFMPRSTHL